MGYQRRVHGQQAAQQKAALEQQSMQLTMEYQQKKAEEEMQKQQFDMEKKQQEMQMKMQEEMASSRVLDSSSPPMPTAQLCLDPDRPTPMALTENLSPSKLATRYLLVDYRGNPMEELARRGHDQ